jgi:hypothetical protein
MPPRHQPNFAAFSINLGKQCCLLLLRPNAPPARRRQNLYLLQKCLLLESRDRLKRSANAPGPSHAATRRTPNAYAAQDWGPLAGRRVCVVLDAKEANETLTLAAGRDPATKVAGRRTSRDTVCASAAEKRLRVAAAKQIAARAQRRKAARRRKSNHARDKL